MPDEVPLYVGFGGNGLLFLTGDGLEARREVNLTVCCGRRMFTSDASVLIALCRIHS